MDFCVKRPVSAVVTLKDGRILIGGNVCTNPQTKCPRQPGEGYQKCYTVCGQLDHAEQVAIRLLVREQLPGNVRDHVASIDVYNHAGPCDACKRMLGAFGLERLTKFHALARPAPLDADDIDAINKEYGLNQLGSHSKQQGDW
ncbi:hypothetical protein [Stenotrophomonas phage BUCTxx99]|nr:hypothetical protein [Stenotrophomonas phage BUCTxx99]